MEAFVLSRVDGRASGAEIALTTGLPASEVVAILLKLRGVGAVEYPDGVPAASTVTSGINLTASRPEPSAKPTSDVQIRVAERPAYDPRELDEPADLEPERKHQILQTFHRLADLTHYALLGVARDAEKKAIKNAYYDVVGRFHPDKYFGKSLGGFKPKLERIFQRVTEAHDTLTRAASREEYDRYLESQQATRAFEEVEPGSVDDIRREIEREARLADQSAERATIPSSEDVSKRTSSPPRGVHPSGGPAGSSMPPFSDAPPRPALSAEERRRALARKLGASVPPAARQAATDRPATAAPTTREAAGEALRRRYEARLEQAKQERVQRYVKQADDAIAANNLVAAANALRIAVSLAPEDLPLIDQLDKVERQAAATLSDQYLEQARYDERRGHMAEAAHAYEKVLRGRPSAHVYERAAHCLLEAQKDPKKAFDLAKKAVELSPNETAYRITLARVYAKAGMEASALGELERARTLDPGDDTVKDWIKRMKRGEI
jgi:curved DNA-binding protein CbpA